MELAKTRKFLGIKFRQTFNLKQPHKFFLKNTGQKFSTHLIISSMLDVRENLLLCYSWCYITVTKFQPDYLPFLNTMQ